MRTFQQNQIMYLNFMLGSNIIYDIYISCKKGIMSVYNFVKDLPNWYRNKIIEFKDYLIDLKYKLNNLASINIELGIYHLCKNHLNDAIIRFKLVDRFFRPGDTVANYWLGWCYFLKNNYESSIKHLEKAKEQDQVELQRFLKNHLEYSKNSPNEIPAEIWSLYRDLTAENYIDKYNHKTINLPYNLVQAALSTITDLPDNYTVLELGSNVGIVGYEIRKRFPDGLSLTGFESSAKMIELTQFIFPDVYDHLAIVATNNLHKQTTNKFDIILSFNGFSFTNNLGTLFDSAYLLLHQKGYLAFCLPVSDDTILSLKHKHFSYKPDDIKKYLTKSGFSEINYSEFTLGINNKYSIVACKKY